MASEPFNPLWSGDQLNECPLGTNIHGRDPTLLVATRPQTESTVSLLFYILEVYSIIVIKLVGATKARLETK